MAPRRCQARIGFIAQNRGVRSGEWMPEHHLKAATAIAEFANRSIPIVSLMDTPGAAGDEIANKNNQSHSISRLIAEMSNTDVPNLGIVYGLGYSGGAIPLAASNLILSVRDGVFSTIQPKGLASIARRLNLSWQQCAKQVGLSPFELKVQGNIDADHRLRSGRGASKTCVSAIVSGIQHVEEGIKRFVRRQSLRSRRIPAQHRTLSRIRPNDCASVQASAAMKLTKNPTEYLNVFGIAYRYLRYLQGAAAHQGDLHAAPTDGSSEQELPAGELDARTDRERRETFLQLAPGSGPGDLRRLPCPSAWKNYVDRKQTVHDERGRIMQFIFGERRQNYEDARRTLISTVGMYLYNRWKNDAAGNFRSLKAFAENVSETRHLFRVSELNEPRTLIDAIRDDDVLGPALRQRFTHEGMKLFGDVADKSDAYLREQIAAELNMAITEGPLGGGSALGKVVVVGDAAMPSTVEASTIVANRLILDDRLPQRAFDKARHRKALIRPCRQ